MAATIVKSIGTTGRDYTTITLWEAAIPADLQVADEIWKGECYKDSVFDESVDISGHNPDATRYSWLTIAVSQRHSGKRDTGVILRHTSSSFGIRAIRLTDPYSIVGWFCIDGVNQTGTTNYGISLEGDYCIARRNVIYDLDTTSSRGIWGADNGITNCEALNNIIHSCYMGILQAHFLGSMLISNNTVYNAADYGIQAYNNGALSAVRNNISMDSITADFDNPNTFGAESDYNLDSDGTAPGSNSQKNKTASNQFVSISGGSEDLHLKPGADAIGNGTDLGTSSEVNIDIDGRDRDAKGDIWDIGADQTIVNGIKKIFNQNFNKEFNINFN